MDSALTYLEKYVEVNQDVPTELQRLLTSISDLDERVTRCRDEVQEKVNECLELPSFNSRGISKDNENKIKKLRLEIEEAHEHCGTLSKEKIRLAELALEILEKNVMPQMDEDLVKYHEDLKATQELDLEQIGTPVRGPSRQGFNRGDSNLQQFQQQQQQVGITSDNNNNMNDNSRGKQLSVGDLVAANIGELNTGPGAHEWIVGTITKHYAQTDEYDIVDADDQFNNQHQHQKKNNTSNTEQKTYKLSASKKSVVPLPKTANPSHGYQVFQDDSFVLAVYPNTTTFYKAKVIKAAQRLPNTGEYGEYTLEFEDDGDVPRRDRKSVV